MLSRLLPWLVALAAALLGSPSLAADPVGALEGVVVEQVSLEAPQGGLPRENLQPLLRVRQGEPLDLGDVRVDTALLLRAGDFASVEAIAEPWFRMNEAGEVEDAVRMVYRVLPPPRLSAIDISGDNRAARQIARTALNLVQGDPFYADAEVGALEARVQRALVAEGWVDARATVRVSRDVENNRILTVTLDLGEPQTWGEITLLGDDLLRDSLGWRCRLTRPDCRPHRRRVERILRRHGVVEGRRVVRREFDLALIEIRDELVALGWFNLRVANQVVPTAEGQSRALIKLEGQGRLSVDLERDGRGRVPRRGELQEVLGLYEGTRATPEAAEESALRLRTWLDERGHPDATVEHALRESPQGHVLALTADPGPWLRLRRIEVEGATTYTPRYVAAALREADPDGLGDRVVSETGVDRAVGGLVEFYRGQGFLDASVTVQGIDRSRASWAGLFRERRRATVRVQVEEGNQTRLVELRVQGLEDDDPGQQAIATARAELVGEPYRPARLDAVNRTVTGAWRSRGHLSANVRTEVELSEDRAFAVARLMVEPGPEVRLRSVVVQGNRRTRRSVIQRELALTVGEPVTPDGIRATRSNLYSLDLFRAVSPELVGDDDRFRDLLITLDEKPNLLFEVGGGLSTDQGIRTNAQATHRNVGGLGHKITLFGQVGYGWFGDTWRFDLDQPVWQAALRYTAPHVPTVRQDLQLEGVIGETLQEPVFRLWRTGGTVALRGTLGRWEGRVGYRAQLRRLEDVEIGALVTGDPWLDALGLEADGTGRARLPSAVRFVTGPTLLVVRDGRNDRFNPTKGAFFSTVAEMSDGLANQPLSIRGLLRLEQLINGGPVLFNLGARAGAGWVFDDATTLPLEERFFLGGSGSLRGFALNTVGPANYAGRPQVPFPDSLNNLVEGAGIRGSSASWVPTGGDLLVSGTVEVRLPFSTLGLSSSSSTQWVLFSDVGQVGFLDPDVQPTSTREGRDKILRVGLGTGLRVSTPVGPAAVDLGVNPWRQSERNERSIVAHLSLGEL